MAAFPDYSEGDAPLVGQARAAAVQAPPPSAEQKSVLLRARALARQAQARANAAAAAAKIRVQQTQAAVASAACDAQTRLTEYIGNLRLNAATFVVDTRAGVEERYAVIREELANIILAAQKRASLAASDARSKGANLATSTRTLAADPKVQITAASAATGAVAVGTGGAAVGFASGGLIGAAVGVVPAVFTMGLSIPLCASVGAGAGFLTGAVSGGSVGLVSGGAVGYGAYSHREAIGGACQATVTRARAVTSGVAERLRSATSCSASLMKGSAAEAQATAKASMSSVRARLLAATGGSFYSVRSDESRESLMAADGDSSEH